MLRTIASIYHSIDLNGTISEPKRVSSLVCYVGNPLTPRLPVYIYVGDSLRSRLHTALHHSF